MAAFNDLVALDELWPYALAHTGMTGIPQARDAIAHADENSWSPMEVVMRLIWTCTAGMPRPLMNRPVFDLQGRHIGTPDLLDVEAGVYGEYDSELHLDGRRRLQGPHPRGRVPDDSDSNRVVMVTGESRDEVAARIVAAYERAMRAQPSPTVDDRPTHLVDPHRDRRPARALAEAERARLLARRTA